MSRKKVTQKGSAPKKDRNMFVPCFVGRFVVQTTPVKCLVMMTESSSPQLKASTIKNNFTLVEHILYIVKC